MGFDLKMFSGSSSRRLAKHICEYLEIPLGDVHVGRFSDGEINIKYKENIRGADIYIIQSTSSPVNEHLMEILIMVDAAKRASANRITAVIPYYGYARQDRKDAPRVPITAKLVADLLTAAGINRILTVDLHADQIQGYFNLPVDHLYAAPVILNYVRNLNLKDIVVVSPDSGGVERARWFATRLKADLAIIDKRRTAPNVAEAMNVIGEIKDKDTIILDDIIDTAGTLTKSAEALLKHGAKSVRAAASHPVFSGDAIKRIEESELTEVIVTDSITPGKDFVNNKIKILTVAPILGEAIRRIHQGESVSSLFL